MSWHHLFAALLAAMLVPTDSIAKPGVAFQSPSGEPMRLLGHIAFGSAEDIAALEKDLASLATVGVKTARPKTPDGRIELMALFGESVGPITATLVRLKMTDGKLGKFEVETIVVPEASVK